jgi:hypothetical protein
MEESINYDAIIAQLQFENEMLRGRVKPINDVYASIDAFCSMVQDMWIRVTANKVHLLVGLMLIYWALSIALVVYDWWVR